MRAPLVVLAVLLAGCAAGPQRGCSSSPTMAAVAFAWDGDESALMDALREEGWHVESTRPRTLGWSMRLDGWEGHGEVVPVDGPGQARIVLRGFHGDATVDQARAELSPAVDPLLARFGGNATYRPGWQVC